MSQRRKYFYGEQIAEKDATRRGLYLGVVSNPLKMAEGYFYFTDALEGVQEEPGEIIT